MVSLFLSDIIQKVLTESIFLWVEISGKLFSKTKQR